jgi:hypothetical protein
MEIGRANPARTPLSHAFELREAVLLLFCDPVPGECSRLFHPSGGLSRWDSQRLLHWLDTSGLALYFFDRVRELGLTDALPEPVITRLRRNLADNFERMEEMIAESITIQRLFQQAGLSYAVLKGFSLWPLSTPKLELRSQLDLDFLVAEECGMEARRILEGFGYRLNAISGNSWEFKSVDDRPPSLSNLYKKGQSRSVELHIETAGGENPSRLSRTETMRFHDALMPVLSPIDLFLGQGTHLFKHVSSEFLRAAHLIEFRRHIIARRGDSRFWSNLERQASTDPETYLKLGTVVLLISRAMGQFAPDELTSWTADRLPLAVRRWVDLYGLRTALASFPGGKSYLLLEKELEAAGLPAKRPLRRALVPHRMPPAITQPVAGEGIFACAKRYQRECRFVLFRLRFHAMEGIRYLRQSILWRQLRTGDSR